MKRKLTLILAVATLVIFSGLAIHGAVQNRQEFHRQNIELESKTFKLEKIESDFKQLNQDYQTEVEKKDSDQQKLKEYEDRIQKMEQEYRALEVSKAAEKAEQARLAAATPKLSATASAAGGCNTGNKYKDFIYFKESTCNPGATNEIGCRGLGQACPGQKLPCSDSDYACQDIWFSNYAIERYGSWEGAYNFWLRNNWW